MSDDVRLPNSLSIFRSPVGLGAGAGLLLMSVIFSLIFRGDEGWLTLFYRSYLNAFVLVAGIGIGSLALLFIHHMTSGAWSFVIQRILEANSRTLILIAILFIPIFIQPVISGGGLYAPWVNPTGEFAEVVETKHAYLNTSFWVFRSLIYFTVFLGMMFLLNSWSRRLEETGDALIILKFRRFSPPGLIVWCLMMTFAALDWVMSLTPAWFSTIYGPLFWISQGLTILAFSIILLSYMSEVKPLSRYVTVEHFHNLANLMLAFTVLWAYMSFSQYLIIWSGNLPEEILWYLMRGTDGLNVLAIVLMMFHFFIPLVVLLQRRVSTNVIWLRRMCYYVLIVRVIDIFWIVNPSYHHEVFGIRGMEVFLYVITLAGMFLLWFWFFLGELTKRSLLPLNDPRFHEAMGQSHGSAQPEVPEHA